MVWAALRLHQATGKASYLQHATSWTAVLDQHYWDGERGGYFTAAADTTDVIIRLKSAHDDAAPSANAIQLSNLIALAAITGDAGYDSQARAVMNAFGGEIAGGPVGHCGLLAAGLDLDSLVQVAVNSGAASALSDALRKISLPGSLEYTSEVLDLKKLPPNLSGKFEISGKSIAYVCCGPVCSAPIAEPEAFRQRLTQARRGDAGST
jgi:uncharacterized protein